MKRIVIIALMAMVFYACGKSGPKADGERWCELEKAIEKARSEGNRVKANKLKLERKALYQEMEERYQHDEMATDELESAYQECRRNSK